MSSLQLTHKPKFIICDVDKTLTGTNSWYTLTALLNGDVEKHYELYNQYYKGKISYEEMKTGLFVIWEEGFGRKITRDDLEDLLFKVELRGEAFSTFGDIMAQGYEMCLISSFMDVYVKMAADRLRINYWYANSVALFDEDDIWIDFSYDKNESGLKVKQMEQFLSEHNINAEDCLILGDGTSEIGLFQSYPGVAIDTENDELKNLAWREVKFFPSILQILQTLPEK